MKSWNSCKFFYLFIFLCMLTNTLDFMRHIFIVAWKDFSNLTYMYLPASIRIATENCYSSSWILITFGSTVFSRSFQAFSPPFCFLIDEGRTAYCSLDVCGELHSFVGCSFHTMKRILRSREGGRGGLESSWWNEEEEMEDRVNEIKRPKRNFLDVIKSPDFIFNL